MRKPILILMLYVLSALSGSSKNCTSAVEAVEDRSKQPPTAPVNATPKSKTVTTSVVDPVTGNVTTTISTRFETLSKLVLTIETRECSASGDLISGTFFQEVNCIPAKRHYVRQGTIQPVPNEKQREIITMKETGAVGTLKVDNTVVANRYDQPDDRMENWIRTPNDPKMGLATLPAKERLHTLRPQHLLLWNTWLLPSADVDKTEADMKFEFKDDEFAEAPCYALNEPEELPPGVVPAVVPASGAASSSTPASFSTLLPLLKDEAQVSP